MVTTDGENLFAPEGGKDYIRSINRSYYDILDVSRSANRSEIRTAYFRMKSSLGSLNGAGYSLIEQKDSQKALSELEEAYRTLDDDYLRKRYDLELEGDLDTDPLQALNEDVPVKKPLPAAKKSANHAKDPEVQEAMRTITSQATEVDGKVLQKLRITAGVDPQEIQKHLKISTYYVTALENDDFATLPPLVYVRGFLKSFLEYLGVSNSLELIDSYSRNYEAWKKKNDKKKLL